MMMLHGATLAVTLALAAGSAGGCQPQPSDTPPPVVAVHHDGGDGALDFTCDGNGNMVSVQPDTKSARQQAAAGCAKTQRDLDNLPWPSGVHPIH